MNRGQALEHTGYFLDDALCERSARDRQLNCVFVGWNAGSNPMFVCVWSYLGNTLDKDEAEELATDLLKEKRWFADNDNPPAADYVL
ncbi:hypothetical protein Lumi_084 [Xylophilus phage Lumi]|nr:hypothetical protein Lumi_084 [Xylophilus phage Lumi]